MVQAVLPWSNWQWEMPCASESSLSLRARLQGALWVLGGVPRYSQTDQSSTATHQLNFKLPQAIAKLQRFDAMILDDLGYVQQSREEMDVLFLFLAERYVKKTIVITSNLVFSQWDRSSRTR